MVGGGGTWGYRVQEERPALIKLSEQVLQGHTNIETGDTNISKEPTNIEGDTNISKEATNIWQPKCSFRQTNILFVVHTNIASETEQNYLRLNKH